MTVMIVLILTRHFTRINYVDQFKKGHREGDTINNTGFKFSAIIIRRYGRITEKVHIIIKASSLRCYVQIFCTPYNDILKWLVHSEIHSLMKYKKESISTTDYYFFSPTLVIFWV